MSDTPLTIEKKERKQQPKKAELMQLDQSPAGLIALAVNNDLDIEKLQKLIEMKNAADARVARMQFLEALGKFQGIVTPLIKNKEANFEQKEGRGAVNYKYQQLADIERHIKPFLKECGLAYRWGQKDEGGNIHVWLILSHLGGHEEVGNPITGAPDIGGAKNLIQQKASTITYLRRYTLTGGLGLASADPDNDGTGGQKAKEKTGEKPPLKDSQLPEAIKKISEGKATLENILEKCSLTEKQKESLEKAQVEFNKKQNAKQD